MKPFRFFLGGYIGSGQQWLSWISIDDVIEAIRFLIENENCIGIYNLTAAEPIQLKDFCRILGKQMKRPCWTVIPSFAARLLFGQMAEELLLASYKITPKRLIESEYKFKYKQVDDFLSSMFHKD
jgi:hypothetical protein